MRHHFPYARPGMVVGLLGGSFDPAHAGHVHITEQALRRFGLHRVWWLVTPGNPLKHRGPAPLAKRVARAQAIMRHPRVEVTDIEAHLGTRYTAQTLGSLTALYPSVRFVWLMGADNLVQFHHWDRWRHIIETVPMGILARPGDRIAARTSRAAQIYWQAKVPAAEARGLGHRTAPAWAFVNVPMHGASSSAIRAKGQWT
ncbi:MAG: nicotinate-nucleotide adenylyltransferase [Pseudomonadota bacterium]